MRRRVAAWLVVVIAACQTKSEPPATTFEGGGGPGGIAADSGSAPAATGRSAGSDDRVGGAGAPLRIEFGPCADATTSFISTEPAPPMMPVPGSGLTGSSANAGAMGDVNGLRIGGDLGPPHGHGESIGIGSRPGFDHPGRTGRDVRAPVPTDGPSIVFGDPTVQGELDAAIIRRYVRRSAPSLTKCYATALSSNPKLGGVVAADFMIDGGGTVIGSTADGVDPKVSSCVADVIKAIAFPKPKGTSVKVRYPLTFASNIKPPAGNSYRPTPKDPPAVAFTDPKVGKRENPLRDREAALAACFANQKFGVVTVAMGYDAQGNVTGTTVAGTFDAKTASCVADAAKGARQVAGIANETCGFAFGEAAVADWTNIAITDTAIAWSGTQELAKSAEVASSMQIRHVYDRVRAWDHENREETVLVPIGGPIAIRVQPTTSMKLVNRVAYSIQSAGVSYALAVDDKLLGAKKLPRPPQPQLIGGVDATPQLSVLVTPKVIWVGVSRTNKFEQLDDDAKLAAALRLYKASADFKDRTRIEIAADDALTFARVIALAAIVEQAGFTDWQILPPPSLSADPRK